MTEQATSYEAQMTYYKTYIEGHEDWEFVGMYSDEGITATNTKKRDGFNQMVEDALDGKIDLIITKSVSRFARNTVDSLTTIRKLKDKGIEVYFEKENIWTLDAKGELMITIMSSLAQEESRSISENTTWGKRKQYADGKGSVAFSWFLGYDKDFKINEEQAATVRLIYRLFISGLSFYAITKEMESRGIKSPSGKDRWHISTVKSILTNEKYRGDALLQTQYTTDFLQKKRKTNNGEIPQYYVEE
ncbi:recombinase family protein, partial [Blautia sp.]|uniref:recombinase family protein n=1 Tax=Blautia sp. TaxID=1955243 RepID=UPI00258E608B